MAAGSLTVGGIPFTLRRGGILPYMKASRRGRGSVGGQVIVEYLLMTAMLLFLFTGMYKLLQSNLKSYFAKAGQVILTAYY